MKLFFILLSFIIPTFLKAQDILVMKNGDEVKVKTLEISADNVKYKKWDNLDGPVYSLDKKIISKIIYQNGATEDFGAQPIQEEDGPKEYAVINTRDFILNELKNRGGFTLIEFTKLNGANRNINGEEMYSVDFRIVVSSTDAGWIWGNFKNNDMYSNGFSTLSFERRSGYMPDSLYISVGSDLEITGTDLTENTDNGYVHKNCYIKTITPLPNIHNPSPVGKGRYYHIVAMQSGKVLEVQADASTGNKMLLKLADPAETDNQAFTFKTNASGYCSIISKATGNVVEIPGSNTNLFFVSRQDKSYFEITSSNSNKAISIPTGSTIKMLKDVKGDNQLFSFAFSGDACICRKHNEPQWRTGKMNEPDNLNEKEKYIMAMINDKYDLKSKISQIAEIDSFSGKYASTDNKLQYFKVTNVNKKKNFVRFNRGDYDAVHLWEVYDFYNGILFRSQFKPYESENIFNFNVTFLYLDKNGDLVEGRCSTQSDGNISLTEEKFIKKE